MIVSVIIPCRNEAKNIEECIRAIYASQFQEDVNLLVHVVDGLSNDGTLDVISTLQKNYDSLQIVENTQQLTPFAFNLGIRANEADYYQIIGARQVISVNYLQDAITALKQDASIWCVGGAVENVYLNHQGKMIANAMSTSFGMGLGNFRTLQENAFVDTVGTPMYPKWVFEKIGYFDEALVRNQDDEFNFRVTQAGGKILFHAGIQIRYYVRGNYPNLWKQFLQYGYWKVFVNRKHKAVTTYRQLIPPFFVAYLFLSWIGFLVHPLVGFIGLSGLILYLFLLLAISFLKGQGIEEKLNLLLIFPILHISYGWGYLKGIVDFLILNKQPSNKHQQLSR